ncbi:MAG TPA: TIR domain-containing protein [Thermoanaerobaculia bacterium]|jgi:WD40 repeat protein|nr:TIR domain-containing protein [Thermoanaerobaculia bacterium]
MANRYDVFLSHSSADQPAVEKLAHKLRKLGLKPFFDKWELIPGRLWQTDLENGLRDSGACVIFVGTENFGPWHSQEMRVAIDRGAHDPDFAVIPVLLPGFKKPTGIPSFLALRGWIEFANVNDEDAFHSLVSGIQGKAPGPGLELPVAPSLYRCMAQPPEGFIHRSEYEKVLEAFCPKDGITRVSPSVGITTALRGAGGFGKTALAQAICFDERVRRHYPDGILWTTMGENLDPEGRVSRILDLLRWWTNTEPPGFKDLQAAGAKLREILIGQKVLVVVDDVWSLSDVLPFQGLGDGSAILITTRDSQTLPGSSVRVEVDAMASREAVSLLRSELSEGQDGEFTSLAARLGEWPLLLKLVNRQLRELVKEDGFAILDALLEVNSNLDSEGFSAFDQDNPESRHSAVSRAILVSVRRLTEIEQDLYFQLAVFPEDAEIPLAILASYWQLSHFGARKLCGRLYDLSLLRDFEVKSGVVRLHDVIRKILIEQNGADISSLHNRLLDSHCPASGRWADLAEEDQYLWRNLAGHLLGAGRIAELRDLLVDFSFLEAKLKATDINALSLDYANLAGGDQEFRLIQGALQLSAHILGRDKQQLAPQLLGRLLNRKELRIERLLAEASSWQQDLWLRPRMASLIRPGGALIRVLEGHEGRVNAVAVLDCGRVVSASADWKLRVWDLKSGRTLQILEGHTGGVLAVAVLNEDRVVSASVDQTLRVWDLKSGQTLQTLEGHTGGVQAVAVLDGRRAISASVDRTLRVWDLERGKILQTLGGHTDRVTAVAVLDCSHIISASVDGALRIWDLESGRTLQILEGHTNGVHAVAKLDGGRVISASADGTLRVWELESGRTLHILEGHRSAIRSVAKMAGDQVVSASDDRTLRVWDLKSGQTLQALEGHTDWVRAVAVLDGQRVVSAANDRMLRVWHLENGSVLQTLERQAWVHAVVVLDGRRVASASSGGALRVWNLDSGKILQTLKGHSGRVRAAAVLAGGQVISASEDRTLRVWDLENGRTLQILEGHADEVHAVAVLNGRRAVSASNDKTLRLWDLESGRTLQVLEGHAGGVRALRVLDSGQVLSASDDGTLRLWDLESGCTLQILEGHSGGVRALAVLDGQRIVSTSADRTLRVWDLASGQALQTLKGHTGVVRAVAVLGDGRLLSASNDRTLRLWDLKSGETLEVMTLDAPPTAVAVSWDGRIVVVGDQAGRMHFFDWVAPEDVSTVP